MHKETVNEPLEQHNMKFERGIKNCKYFVKLKDIYYRTLNV